MEITFGGYAMPVVLSVILSLVFKVAPVADRWKAPIAVFSGMCLGLLGLAYQGKTWDVKNIVDFVLYGLMVGAGAVGVYEITRSAVKPRS